MTGTNINAPTQHYLYVTTHNFLTGRFPGARSTCLLKPKTILNMSVHKVLSLNYYLNCLATLSVMLIIT